MSLSPAETARRAASSALCASLEEARGRLASHAYFIPMKVLTQDDGDIDTIIAKRLGSLGLCVTVMFEGADVPDANVGGPVVEGLGIIVEVAENTRGNKTGRTALETVERVMRRLHRWRSPGGNLYVLRPKAVQPVPPPKPANIAYHVAFDDESAIALQPLENDSAD